MICFDWPYNSIHVTYRTNYHKFQICNFRLFIPSLSGLLFEIKATLHHLTPTTTTLPSPRPSPHTYSHAAGAPVSAVPNSSPLAANATNPKQALTFPPGTSRSLIPSISANTCHGVVPFFAGHAKKPVDPKPVKLKTPRALSVPGAKANPSVVPLLVKGWPSAWARVKVRAPVGRT